MNCVRETVEIGHGPVEFALSLILHLQSSLDQKWLGYCWSLLVMPILNVVGGS
jgi:hypothetical protein